MNRGTCRGCGAQIVWIRTAGGKAMPCDPDMVTYWQSPQGHQKIVTPNGEVVSAELFGMPGMATGMGYISHFATCPEAGKYGKR